MNYPQNPLFVIGSPRSGTTALSGALDIMGDRYFHPSTECHFLYWFLDDTVRLFDKPENFSVALDPMALATPKNHEVLKGAIADSIHEIYRRVGQETGDRNWIDKTPDFMQARVVPFMMDLMPGARTILIHRHPLEVFISTINKWNIEDREQKKGIVERWTITQQCYRTNIQPAVSADRLHVIRQDNLVRRTSETVRNLLEFLNNSPDIEADHSRMFEFLRDNEVNRSTAHEGKSYDVKDRASDEDIELVREFCGEEMKYWNYSLD